MRRFLCLLACLMLAGLAAAAVPAAEKEAFTFKKQPELQQPRPKKPVRIKLKRSAKDDYTWELSGDDVDEIVRTDRKLRRMLNVP
ncbi:MAG: hypothetical protein OHK006_19000 [Thermodesulfovibrionales bacterium]